MLYSKDYFPACFTFLTLLETASFYPLMSSFQRIRHVASGLALLLTLHVSLTLVFSRTLKLPFASYQVSFYVLILWLLQGVVLVLRIHCDIEQKILKCMNKYAIGSCFVPKGIISMHYFSSIVIFSSACLQGELNTFLKFSSCVS